MSQAKSHLFAGLAAFAVAATPSVSAQTLPDSGSLLRDQQQIERRLPDRLPESEPREEVKPEMKPTPGVKITLKTVRFSGAQGLATDQELQAQVSDAIGKELDFAGLQALTEKVTKYLKAKGFFLAHAYLPKQEITEGVVEIAILPGRLEGKDGDVIDVKPEHLRVPEQTLEEIAAGVLVPGTVTRTEDMERVLLLMNDLPGISARSTIGLGSTPGTSRLVVEAEEGPIFTGSAWFDNYGNRYNGAARVNGLVNVNDPFGLADQTSLLVTTAEDLLTGMMSYRVPVGASGFKLAGSFGGLKYETGKELENLRLKGSALTFTARASYPVVRTRRLNLNVMAGYDWKALIDEAADITTHDKRVNDLSLALSGNLLDGLWGGGFTGWSLGAVFGDIDLSRVPADLAADQATVMVNGGFDKFTYSLSRHQKLPGTFSFYASITGQLAGHNLDSSEEFSLGGPYGLRAYPVSEGAGDEGWLANFELRYDVPVKLDIGTIQLVGFFDTGEVELHNDLYPGVVTNNTDRNRYGLSGAGVGTTLLKIGTYSVRAVWATTIGDNPGRSVTGKDADGNSHDNRFWLQGMIWL